MNHPREDLTAFVDGALAPPRASEVEAHLAACPDCRAEAARLRSTVAAFGALPPAPELPPGFSKRLSTRLEARVRQERETERARPSTLLARLGARLPAGRPRLLAYAGGAAALLLAAGLPAGAWLRARAETRTMVQDLDLLQDWDTASAVAVDSPEDAQIVARLDELERGEAVP